MLNIFLAYLDQFRAVVGMIVACLLFCRHAAPKREGYTVRLMVCSVICLAMGFAYVPIGERIATLPTVLYGVCSVGYWIAVTVLVCVMVYQCYEFSPCNAMFRTLLGCALESIVTTFIRYLIVMMWLPEMPQRAPVSYILLCLSIYLVMYSLTYRILARQLQQGAAVLEETRGTFIMYFLIIFNFLLIMYATNGICEWLVPMLRTDPSLYPQYDLIRYFCVGIRFLICTAILIYQYFVFETNFLQHERDLVSQALKEKSAQYEFNRENIEFIQQKCHDLKRQLRALEVAGDQERQAVLEETRRAAEFYDATIQTGHEVLDTLLTEKTLLCANRSIRLSCTVSVRDLSAIGTVDLYTMLSNALDNAIEAVEQITEPGRKTIRFSMTERGSMLHIEVENYYDGAVETKNGVLVTSKADKNNHGIGVRSIRTLAQRYGGDISISTEEQIFLLQIAIPIA